MVSKLLVRASESDRLQEVAMGTSVTRRISRRFIAGERLDDATDAARALVASGRTVSLDLVGERVRSDADADAAATDYQAVIEAMSAEELPSGISVKPSQLGTGLDPDRARQRLTGLAEAAGAAGLHLTLDMEDANTVDPTIDLVTDLHEAGHTHVGCAVQAALHRTLDDIDRLNELGASLRLCKGAYAEAAEISHQRREDIDAAYLAGAERLLRDGTYPRFATHDHQLIGSIRRAARDRGRTTAEYEFQMLYGIRDDVQRRLVGIGEQLCVYLPFGDAWYPYFVRRLAERPANMVFFARALLPG